MRIRWLILSLTLFSRIAFSGDSAGGSILYATDLSQVFATYTLSARDRAWGTRLAHKFGYREKVVYFVRTSLVLSVNGAILESQIYQDTKDPTRFYVVAGDAMLTVGNDHPNSPGVGGFSMHANIAKNFITCFHCNAGGVPFIWSTPVIKGKVSWLGGSEKRLE